MTFSKEMVEVKRKLNEIPSFGQSRWAHEIKIIQPTIINGDLSQVK